MSDIIVKIERSNGEIFYKCDTFWSLSKTKKEAKIHNLIDNDIEDHLLKTGNYVYKLQYDENENIFKLIDIKRKQKLEQINKRIEEDYA